MKNQKLGFARSIQILKRKKKKNPLNDEQASGLHKTCSFLSILMGLNTMVKIFVGLKIDRSTLKLLRKLADKEAEGNLSAYIRSKLPDVPPNFEEIGD